MSSIRFCTKSTPGVRQETPSVLVNKTKERRHCEEQRRADNVQRWNEKAWYAGASKAMKSTADVSLLQEVRLTDEEQCKRAEDPAKGHGWNAKLSAANKTDKGGASAGVAFMTKKNIGMASDASTVGKKFRPRVAHA